MCNSEEPSSHVGAEIHCQPTYIQDVVHKTSYIVRVYFLWYFCLANIYITCVLSAQQADTHLCVCESLSLLPCGWLSMQPDYNEYSRLCSDHCWIKLKSCELNQMFMTIPLTDRLSPDEKLCIPGNVSVSCQGCKALIKHISNGM